MFDLTNENLININTEVSQILFDDPKAYERFFEYMYNFSCIFCKLIDIYNTETSNERIASEFAVLYYKDLIDIDYEISDMNEEVGDTLLKFNLYMENLEMDPDWISHYWHDDLLRTIIGMIDNIKENIGTFEKWLEQSKYWIIEHRKNYILNHLNILLNNSDTFDQQFVDCINNIINQ